MRESAAVRGIQKSPGHEMRWWRRGREGEKAKETVGKGDQDRVAQKRKTKESQEMEPMAEKAGL